MPDDSVIVFVVEDGQTGLVMELLETLDGDADVVLGVDGPLLDSLVVVRLGLPFPEEGDKLAHSTATTFQLTLQSGSSRTCPGPACQWEESCRCWLRPRTIH